MSATVLLIIDIQNDYFPGGHMALSGPEAAAAQAAHMLNAFRGRGWPVVHIQHESVRSGAAFMVPGTVGQQIHPAVTPADDETVIVKHYPSAFQETVLEEHLRDTGVGELVVCGMMTHMCVDTSVRSAFERGFRCTLIGDATATRDLRFGGHSVPAASVQAAYLAALDGTFAKVSQAAAWLGGVT